MAYMRERQRRGGQQPREVSYILRETSWAPRCAAPPRILAVGLHCRATRQQDLTKGTTYVNTNPGGGADPRLSVLLLVTVAAVAAAQSEAWASAVGTAVALYSVLTIGSQDRRN